MQSDAIESDTKARQYWMATLARAPANELETAWDTLAHKPDYTWLRRPEVGMVMVRGRAGGTGSPFNLGEMTVTRCALRLTDGAVGMAFVAGRDRRHAELAAMFDALMQTPTRRGAVDEGVIRPLAERRRAHRDQRSRKANATRVAFFTMVRGEDPE